MTVVDEEGTEISGIKDFYTELMPQESAIMAMMADIYAMSGKWPECGGKQCPDDQADLVAKIATDFAKS